MVATELQSSLETVHNEEPRLIATRESLLSRLRQKETDGWYEFFETYWKLIYNTARKRGLTDDEAQEVVQETMIGVSRNIPAFRYDPETCSFKTWLMNLVFWRIADQFRQRSKHASLEHAANIPSVVEDDASFALLWEQDWERNLINAAVDRVKNRIDPWHFQVFSFCVLQKKGAAETARVLNIGRPRVYLINHRVSKELTKEIAGLRKATGGNAK